MMNVDTFRRWLDAQGAAWEAGDPDAAARLFTADAVYRETPFAEPLRGREAIRAYWADESAAQQDVRFGYEILAVTHQSGIARWWAALTRIPSGAPARVDGIMVARLDESGRCVQLEEWWHAQDQFPPPPRSAGSGAG